MSDSLLTRMSTKMQEALLSSPPLSYFWVVEYWDGQAVAQFNPETGSELMWSSVLSRNKRVKRVMWLPFTQEFAQKVFAKTGTVCRVIPTGRAMKADIPEGAKIILKRKGRIALGERDPEAFHTRAYILGFEFGGEVFVMARDSLGRDIHPMKVAGWVRGMSKADDKGKLPEKD